MIGLFPPVVPIMWHLEMHGQESNLVASLNHKIFYEKQLSTYKWCFLSNQGFNQFLDVFRNWWPVVRTEGNLRNVMYKLRPHLKKEKECTKNTDRFPCCTSIFSRKVSISALVPSSLSCFLVPYPGGRRGPRTCTSFCMSENHCFTASKDTDS